MEAPTSEGGRQHPYRQRDGRLLETTRTVWLGSRVRFHCTD
jgi:hypothetical protein